MFNQLRDLDFRDIGSAPTSVLYVLLSFLLIIIFAIGYFLAVGYRVSLSLTVAAIENLLEYKTAIYDSRKFRSTAMIILNSLQLVLIPRQSPVYSL